MSTAYYSKELPDQPIYILGRAYRFDVFATDDQELIRHLDSAARKHVGGVFKITKSEYEQAQELKKKPQSQTFLTKQPGREEVRQKLIPSLKARGVGRVAVAEDNPNPTPQDVAVTDNVVGQYKPKTGKGIL